MENKIAILYVDDEPNNITAFLAYFRRNKNLILLTAKSGDEGLQALKVVKVHIIISDQKMPNMSGVEFLEQAELSYPYPMKIVLTAHRDSGILQQAREDGKIFQFHDKPWDWEYLERIIREAYEAYCEKKTIK